MVKVSSNDVVSILRRFDYADEATYPRHVEQLKFSHPRPDNTLVSFRFKRRSFYILFDDSAEDDTVYIIDQMRSDKQELDGEVIKNPQDHLTTYALPFKGKEVYLIEVIPHKKRLDVYLAEHYPDISRSTWQKHIKQGHITVNDEVQTSPKYEVGDGDAVAANLPPAKDYESDTLPIIYLDDNVIVVDKPVGILTHAKGALSDEFTVAEFFRRYTTFGLDTNRPGIVHRLDRDTSGVIIGARNPETAAMLQKQFSERTTKKTYLAAVAGSLKHPEAKIDLPIGRHPSEPSTFRVDSKGKSAVTVYSTLDEQQGLALIRLQPLTGRTHQLRVHMAYLGAPILGDRVYGTPSDRLYLHALQLEITIPGGKRMTFSSPAPDEFTSKFPSIKQ